jgi:hypothetical protein
MTWRAALLAVLTLLVLVAWAWTNRYEPIGTETERSDAIVWDRWLHRACYHQSEERQAIIWCSDGHLEVITVRKTYRAAD